MTRLTGSTAPRRTSRARGSMPAGATSAFLFFLLRLLPGDARLHVVGDLGPGRVGLLEPNRQTNTNKRATAMTATTPIRISITPEPYARLSVPSVAEDIYYVPHHWPSAIRCVGDDRPRRAGGGVMRTVEGHSGVAPNQLHRGAGFR